MGKNDEFSGPIPHQLCVSAMRCNDAARASLHLMNLAPQVDFACTWILFSHYSSWFPIAEIASGLKLL
ncbi:hypothetical protein GQ44DRAFT_770951 [Phaeosphaeriaceae sp. PMI808]|nr:hypothetical protein GQ44DRAFT_770951 [Phaeosphaeriaceae sp. PMI808]